MRHAVHRHRAFSRHGAHQDSRLVASIVHRQGVCLAGMLKHQLQGCRTHAVQWPGHEATCQLRLGEFYLPTQALSILYGPMLPGVPGCLSSPVQPWANVYLLPACSRSSFVPGYMTCRS